MYTDISLCPYVVHGHALCMLNLQSWLQFWIISTSLCTVSQLRARKPFHCTRFPYPLPPTHYHYPSVRSSRLSFRTTVNLKPKRERGRSYEPRKEVNAKVLILLGTNSALNRMAWSPYRPHNVLHKSFPVFYAITY